MADDTELETTIEAAAAKPASVTIGNTSTANRPLTELIEADKHLTAKTALAKPRMGLVTRKIARGNTLGE